MTEDEAYKVHIQYTFNAFCKIVIRHAAIDIILNLRRRWEREVSLDYLMNEKFVQFAEPEQIEEYLFTYRLPPMVSPRTKEGDRKALLDSLEKIDRLAEQYGQWLYLEPLNRYQDHMLNTLDDAADLIRAGGFRRVRITADFYHMSIEEDDISASLEKHADLLGHIHIAENHRYQPGSGSIDFARHMQTLRRIGYDGPVVNEGRLRGDPMQACRDGIAYMKPLLRG